MPIAIITGASRGLGLALARALAQRGWALVIDARGTAELERVARELGSITEVVAIPGDVADDWHRGALVEAAGDGIDLLVNNASVLGPSPQPALAAVSRSTSSSASTASTCSRRSRSRNSRSRDCPTGAASSTSPPTPRSSPTTGWGGYGSSKAALEQVSAILAAEQPALRVYAVDPGDMRTRMHQEAFPGEDISDRPPPEDSVPGLLALIEGRLPSGRYQAQELARRSRRWSLDRLRVRVPRGAGGARAARGSAACAATRSGCWSRGAPTARSRTGASPSLTACSNPATCSSSTSRRRSRPRSRPAAPTASVSRCTSRRRRPSSPTAGGWSSCGPQTAGARCVRPSASGSRSTEAPSSSWSRPYASGARLLLARVRGRRVGRRPISSATASRSATATSSRHGRSTPTRTSTRRRPAAPRCRAPAGRSLPS